MKDIILAFFRKDFADSAGLASWLDKHGNAVDPVIENVWEEK
jgi:hypothetical protein